MASLNSKLTVAQSNSDDDNRLENLKRRFLHAALEFHKIGKNAGYRIVPTHDLRLPLFSALPHERRAEAVRVLETSCMIYRSVLQDGHDVKSSLSLIWTTLRELGMVPPSNLFDKIGGADCLEVYSCNGVQLFANFQFFALCSYTLEQIYSIPWTELWYRDEAAMTKMLGIVGRSLGPEQTMAESFEDCQHQLIETLSPFKYKVEYRVKSIAPLWDKHTHKKAGFIIIEQGNLLNKITPQQEEKMLHEFYQKIEQNAADLKIL